MVNLVLRPVFLLLWLISNAVQADEIFLRSIVEENMEWTSELAKKVLSEENLAILAQDSRLSVAVFDSLIQSLANFSQNSDDDMAIIVQTIGKLWKQFPSNLTDSLNSSFEDGVWHRTLLASTGNTGVEIIILVKTVASSDSHAKNTAQKLMASWMSDVFRVRLLDASYRPQVADILSTIAWGTEQTGEVANASRAIRNWCFKSKKNQLRPLEVVFQSGNRDAIAEALRLTENNLDTKAIRPEVIAVFMWLFIRPGQGDVPIVTILQSGDDDAVAQALELLNRNLEHAAIEYSARTVFFWLFGETDSGQRPIIAIFKSAGRKTLEQAMKTIERARTLEFLRDDVKKVIEIVDSDKELAPALRFFMASADDRKAHRGKWFGEAWLTLQSHIELDEFAAGSLKEWANDAAEIWQQPDSQRFRSALLDEIAANVTAREQWFFHWWINTLEDPDMKKMLRKYVNGADVAILIPWETTFTDSVARVPTSVYLPSHLSFAMQNVGFKMTKTEGKFVRNQLPPTIK